jgi:hypothetical protein
MAIVRQMSDMETNARNFARNFARYRAAAARGETVRITAPDGVFLLTREKKGITGRELLAWLNQLEPGKGFLSPGGDDLIEAGWKNKTMAKNPWDE